MLITVTAKCPNSGRPECLLIPETSIVSVNVFTTRVVFREGDKVRGGTKKPAVDPSASTLRSEVRDRPPDPRRGRGRDRRQRTQQGHRDGEREV